MFCLLLFLLCSFADWPRELGVHGVNLMAHLNHQLSHFIVFLIKPLAVIAIQHEEIPLVFLLQVVFEAFVGTLLLNYLLVFVKHPVLLVDEVADHLAQP